jgi:hypothetical protein
LNDKQVVQARLEAIMRSELLPELLSTTRLERDRFERHLNRLIKDAVQRIERDGRLDDSASLAEAERNFHKLLKETRRHGRQFAVTDPRIQLDKALAELCPIWPFC